MILGQSAATAAALALDAGIPVQAVDYAQLAQRLQTDGQVLEAPLDGTRNIAPETLPGVVMDNPASEVSGPWGISGSVPPMVGLNYLHDSVDKSVPCTARYRIAIPAPGRYEVRVSYSPHANRATNALVTINHTDGIENVLVNQRNAPPNNDVFLSLGEFNFEQEAVIVISNENADGHVIADAVQLLSVNQTP